MSVQKLMKEALAELEGIKEFPKRYPGKGSRANVVNEGDERPIEAFVLGLVKPYYTPGLTASRWNKVKKVEKLHKVLRALMRAKDPNYRFTSIQINKNVPTKWHIDKNNKGQSYCLSLGNFTGGELVQKWKGGTRNLITKNRMIKYDGQLEHKTGSWRGTRYAIIWFKR